MKRLLNIALLALLALFVSCAPSSKESYVQKFDEFMTKTAGLYTTCPSKQWIKIEKEFKKYSEEYLKLYEFDLTPEQRVAVQEYVAIFHGFQEFREFNGTKEGYIMAFDKLILEAGRTYDSCTEAEWKALEVKYQLYSDTYYQLFEKELTSGDKIRILGYQTKFVGFQSQRDAGDIIDGISSWFN
ncbi:MAG: hypothetical protein IIX59_00840 [Alistipes sp.]|nr:hypothetical protein [Alistipes sp.]